MGETETISVRAEPELAEALKAKAAAEDITVSQATRRLWRRWIAGEIEASPPTGKEEWKGETDS